MRRLGTVLAMLGLVAVISVPTAGAEQGQKGKDGDSTVTGTITLGGDGSALAAAAVPSYGGEVSFQTTVDGRLANKSKVYITLVCYQGDTVVYQYSGSQSQVFPLDDQAGQGLEWDGGDADCSARLIYRVQKGKSYSMTWLDEEQFHAYGA